MILHGARKFLVVQCPGFGPPTLEAQARHLAGAPRPFQPHSSEKKEERKKERIKTNRTLGQMVKANLNRQKSHKEAYTYTLTKREKGKKIFLI